MAIKKEFETQIVISIFITIMSFEEEEEEEEFLEPIEGEIAKEFYPFDSDVPFSTCLLCKCNLIACDDYLIEKAIRGNDVIFEIAMCMDCAMKMQQELSKESLERIHQFMSRVDMTSRFLFFRNKQSTHAPDYLKHCLVSNSEINPNEEHQIYAHCSKGKMLYGMYPFAMNQETMEEIQSLLSAKTRQALDDFMDTYLIPDDLRDLLKRRPILV